MLLGYTDFIFFRLINLDILEVVKYSLGFRLSLAHLATITLGADKSGDGLQALQWWKQGRILEIIEFCRQDVKLTRDLFRYGRKNGHLVFKDKAGKYVRIPVIW